MCSPSQSEPKAEPPWKSWLFFRSLWVSLQVRGRIMFLFSFRAPFSACCCYSNHLWNKTIHFYFSLPCMCMYIQYIYICFLSPKFHTANLTPHLVTGCGVLERWFKKTSITDHLTVPMHEHKNKNFCMMLLEKLPSASLNAIKSLWLLRFFHISQWKIAAPPAAQMIVPDI